MHATERLASLKKVYAEIIFNMSKEAAMRVMSSQKRAAQYQHELTVTKEEALRMLIRLKQMMELKTSQAEAASFNQQKKIEVLEAQLEEAEDIVNDLRHELGRVQVELERLRQDNVQSLNQSNNAFSGENMNGVTMANTVQQNPCCKCSGVIVCQCGSYIRNRDLLIQQNPCSKCSGVIVCQCSSFNRNRDLLCVTVGEKESRLYINGCAQRIRAFENNLIDKALHVSGKMDKVDDKKTSREHRQSDKEGEETNKAPAPGTKIGNELEKKPLPNRIVRNMKSFSRKRKRAIRKRENGKPLTAFDLAKGSNLFERASELSQTKKSEMGSQIHLGKETRGVEISGEITPQKDERTMEKPVSIDDEARFEDGYSPDSKTDVEKAAVRSNRLESNSCHSSPGLQCVGGRVIKYTFQRKRKREASEGSKSNDAFQSEKITESVQNRGQNKPKTSLVKESSRESRRLAQVARQLISLSEKKWWD